MRHDFMELDWEGAGYHGFPGGDASEDEADAWSGFEQVLARAKQGDFSGVGQLPAIYEEADWMLGAACAELMGDIGDRRVLESLHPAVTAILDPTYSVDLGRTLAIAGHLSSVPVLLEALVKLADFEDAPALVQMLSVMLEPEPGALGDIGRLDDVEAYADHVRRQAAVVAARTGSPDAVVMFGDVFSVERLVAVMRQRLAEGGRFDPYWRHRFEATTGVDCSGFYEDGILQPLQALAVIEEFEDLGHRPVRAGAPLLLRARAARLTTAPCRRSEVSTRGRR